MAEGEELNLKELELKEEALRVQKAQLALERLKVWFLTVPLVVAVVGGLVAWKTSMDVEKYKAQQLTEAKYLETALDLAKGAANSSDVERSRANLRFILRIEVGPEDFRKKLQRYLDDPDATIPTELAGRGTPSAPVVERAQSAVDLPPPNRPAMGNETGWFYLGKISEDRDKWVSSSALGSFEIIANVNAMVGAVTTSGSPTKLTDLKIIRTLSTKYLRDNGAPGQRVLSAVKRTLSPGTVLKILEFDDLGKDGGLPVLWARVEVQGNRALNGVRDQAPR